MKINKELKDLVLNDMPSNFTDIEKAVYIYIKLCKILSYKTSYYASYKKNKGWEDRICNITPNNKEVVCYEFATILKLFFDNLNLKSHIKKYSLGHESTILSFDDYYVEFDSTQSIIYSDMLSAKVNKDIKGIRFSSKKESFNCDELELVPKKVYDIIKLQEKTKLEEDLNNIKKKLEYNPNISQDEIIELFKNAVENTPFDGVDNLGYILLLNNMLSPKRDLLRVNLAGCFIDADDNSKKASAGAIIGINKTGFNGDNTNTMFYWYHDNNGLVDISKEDIISRLNDHEVYFCHDETGPGVTRWSLLPREASFDMFLTTNQVADIVDSSKLK